MDINTFKAYVQMTTKKCSRPDKKLICCSCNHSQREVCPWEASGILLFVLSEGKITFFAARSKGKQIWHSFSLSLDLYLLYICFLSIAL